MHRRHWLHAILVGLSTAFAWINSSAAQTRRNANLQQRLESGLKARLPSEFAFIRRVVQLVDEGKLPEDVVQAAFNWARERRPYPYQYFVRAIRELAARRGVRI